MPTTSDVVLGYLERVKAKSGWEAFLADDLEFTNFAHPVKRLAGKQASVEAIGRFYSMMTAMEVVGLIVEEEHACAVTRYELQPLVGPAFESNIAEVFDVHDGKITSYAIFFDSAPYPKPRRTPWRTVPRAGQYTDRTRRVFDIGVELAIELGHEAVGATHLAVALLREGSGVAVAALKTLGVPMQTLEQELRERLQPTQSLTSRRSEPGWSPDAVHVIADASLVAEELSHSYIGTEHVLLGLLRDSARLPAQVLAHHGVGSEEARNEVLRMLNGP